VVVAVAAVVVVAAVEINRSALYLSSRCAKAQRLFVWLQATDEEGLKDNFRRGDAFRFCICVNLCLSVASNVDDAAH
jgi:hypothetical protein